MPLGAHDQAPLPEGRWDVADRSPDLIERTRGCPVTSSLEQLEAALDEFSRLVAGVAEDQWGLATPCPGWDVSRLVAHVIDGNLRFVARFHGEEPAPETDLRAGVPIADFAPSAQALMAALRAPGALERTVSLPIGLLPGAVAVDLRLTETLVHGWDLARATGQTPRFSSDACASALEFARANLGRASNRPSAPFAPPLPAPEGAPPLDQLAAQLGRDVGGGTGPG